MGLGIRMGFRSPGVIFSFSALGALVSIPKGLFQETPREFANFFPGVRVNPRATQPDGSGQQTWPLL